MEKYFCQCYAYNQKGYRLSKFCVFCGKKPENKNAEHIIPQWLINLTGNKARTCNLEGAAPNNMPFIAFKFPACEKCNTEFSALEGAVKPVVMNILAGNPVTAKDINLLLDWMDKVRVGLWLAMLYLNKEVDEMNPHMHIKSRMGLKDRVLVIERVPECDDGIIFTGPGTVSFKYWPSCFQLRINNYVFTSVSEYGLVARRLGFPYCDRMKFLDIENVQFNTIIKGTGRVVSPVVKSLMSDSEKVIIYQPMFKHMNTLAPNLYDSEYVKSHSLDVQNGVGGIFYQRGTAPVSYLPIGGGVNLTPRVSGRDIYKMATLYHDLSNHVISNTYTYKFASAAVQSAQEKTRQALSLWNEGNKRAFLRASQKTK